MSEGGTVPIALTMGDPSGIGPELALKAWLRRSANTAAFFVLGDPELFRALARRLDLPVPVRTTVPGSAAAAFPQGLPVVPLRAGVTGTPGQPCADDAPATIESIERAVAFVRAGSARAVVTNPIAKHVLTSAGFAHPGHTEFLGELAERQWGLPARPVMMLWSPDLAVVPVTIHVSLARAIATLSTEDIVATGLIVARELASRFAIPSPRLALAGLNPHAGENGTMGREDIDIVAPAVARLRAAGILASGPHPADTLFHAAARKTYDAVLGMYHDQVLIPIKTLAFDTGVNLTLGLPFVRTSPDHGTAFDIAGQGIASVASLQAALALADRLTR